MPGRVFSLDPSVRQLAKDALSDLHEELRVTCRLYYPAPAAPDPRSAGGAGGGWTTGGLPSAASADLPFEDVQLQVAYSPRQFWVKPAPGVAVPAGSIQTKGYQALAAKLARCAKLVVDPDNAALPRAEYVRASDPWDPSSIVRGTFVVTDWDRA